ncbi:hypothetical protein KCU90_g195, partial [Aureobasidium melanogenum]
MMTPQWKWATSRKELTELRPTQSSSSSSISPLACRSAARSAVASEFAILSLVSRFLRCMFQVGLCLEHIPLTATCSDMVSTK